jgi:acyl-CoA reductase-like NAD-dependent aldehyde dehydrogenase
LKTTIRLTHAKPVAAYLASGPEDAPAAIAAAQKAFPAWAALTPVGRGRFLSQAALAEDLTREEGKTVYLDYSA